MVDWEEVRSLARDAVPMEKLIKGYSYADKQSSVVTDEKLCHVIVDDIRAVKGCLFNIIELLYELEKKEPISKQLQRLKDELDIFSDEVKARYCAWKELDVKWSVKLVKHDHDIVTGLKNLNNDLQKIHEKLLADKALVSGDETAEERLWRFVKVRLPDVEKRVDSLVTLFKEREGICNLRPMALEKTYKILQKKIEKQI